MTVRRRFLNDKEIFVRHEHNFRLFNTIYSGADGKVQLRYKFFINFKKSFKNHLHFKIKFVILIKRLGA